MSSNVPVRAVPPPILKENNPNELVVAVCFSEY
jgi:hypothetical protein